MKILVRRMATAATTGALLFGGAVATAGNAQAAPTTQCKTSTKSFDLPGKPDVTVSVKICIQYTGTSSGYRDYSAWVSKASWDGTSSFIGGTRFNSFSIHMRAEHGSTKVTNCSNDICENRDISSEINGSEKGSKTFTNGYGMVYVKTKKKTWTADGYAYPDIASDGKSGKTWELNGTASVS
jgi:hypothetical protein